jgi:Small-conductance mechanosensitive channel
MIMSELLAGISSFLVFIAPKFFVLVAIAAAAAIACFVIKKGFGKLKRIPEQSSKFISKALMVCVIALAGFAALGVIGVNIGSLATIIGAVSVALGFALKNLLSNLANGVIMLWTKPFNAGQNIKVSGNGGKVKTIDLLYTKLDGEDGQEIVIPNGVLSSSVIVIEPDGDND